MPTIVTVQLDPADALAASLGELGAELATEGGDTRVYGARLAAALGGPAGDELASTGQGWAGLVDALAARAQAVATALTQAVASYRFLDELVSERLGAGGHSPTAR